MKRFFIVPFVLIFVCGFSQTKLEINGFSKKYKGVLTIDKGFETEVFKKGNISIIELNTNKKIIDINSDQLTYDLNKNGDVKTNVLQLPYGEQSIIIYQDFNFDGISDLAVMDGQYSCYHGPSFQVYLEINNKLEYSSEFTQLAQEYCGMFQTDYESKTIHTMTKSGCCWHQFSKFKVINNIPKPILIIEEDATGFPFYTTTTTAWNENIKTKRIEKTIDLKQEGVNEIFSFELAKNKKRIVVFNINDQILNYVLIKPNGIVEFSYPTEHKYKNPDFEVDENREYLIFQNKDAIYRIYETYNQNKELKIGILVQVNGKSYHLKGKANTAKGTLSNIIEFDNVVIR